MPLASGARLGPYEVLAPLGAGGMGEVYRARDTKLGRDVALKILPDAFTHDADRVARFRREAHVLATLNHPHIASIYGIEEADGVTALILGTVKVLDFGLAKALEPAIGPAKAGHYRSGDAGSVRLQADLANSPTITSPAMMTAVGMILGTAAYMAPEQARGKAVDKRADIWAFGCVLYEMLTGTRAFGGNETTDTLAFIITKEPDWDALRPDTPAAIHRLLRRSLEKDVKRRLPDIGVARLEIDEASGAPALAIPKDTSQRDGRTVVWKIAAALAGVAAIAMGALYFTATSPDSPRSIRFHIAPPPQTSFSPNTSTNVAVSPDGRHIVFGIVGANGRTKLAIRTFDAEQVRELPGTDGAANVFWSPDNRFIGFFADSKLKKMDVAGGGPQILCDVPSSASGGGTWNGDGTIVLALGTGPLLRVSDAGGTPTPLTMLDSAKKESAHWYPWFLPDGRHFLYAATSSTATTPTSVYVASLDDSSRAPVVESSSKAIYADGFLLFIRQATLLAQPFDATRLLTVGDPVAITQNVQSNPVTTAALFAASGAGMLAYRPTSPGAPTQLVWFKRDGTRGATVGERTDQWDVRLSPDGTKAAVSVWDPAQQSRDIWIHDFTRDLRTRFSTTAGDELSPSWSPDGRRLVFSSQRRGPLDLYQAPADGSGGEELLVASGNNKYVTSWSADGRFILYYVGNQASQTGTDIWILPLSGDRQPRPLLQTRFGEGDARFSPDGRWVVYDSSASGRSEVYITGFPEAAGRWQISPAGGDQPIWRRDGKEIFYIGGNAMMAAEVDGAGSAFKVGAVRRLFEASFRTESYKGQGRGYVYDVTPDGQRFLVNLAGDEEAVPTPITIVTNWTAALRRSGLRFCRRKAGT